MQTDKIDINELTLLVAKAKQKNKKAANLLYMKTWQSVYYTLLRKTGNQEDAQDLLNEVYVSVFENIHKLRDNQAFLAWLLRIAHSSFIKYCQKRGKIHSEDTLEEYTDIVCDENFFPDYAFERCEIRDEILKAINELPPHQSETIYFVYYLNFSIEEIASITNISRQAVYKRLNAAKLSLKEKLEKSYNQGSLYSMAGFNVLFEIFKADMERQVDSTIGPMLWHQEIKHAVNLAYRPDFFALMSKVAISGTVVYTLSHVLTPSVAEQLPNSVSYHVENEMPAIKEIASELESAPKDLEEVFISEESNYVIYDDSEEEFLPNSGEITQNAEISSMENETATQIHTEEIPLDVFYPSEEVIPEEIPKEKEISENFQETQKGEVSNFNEFLDIVYLINNAPDPENYEELLSSIFSFSAYDIDFSSDKIEILENHYVIREIGTFKMLISVKNETRSILLNVNITILKAKTPEINIAAKYLTYTNGSVVTEQDILSDAGVTVSSDEILTIIIQGLEAVDFNTAGNYSIYISANDEYGGRSARKVIFITIQ